MHDDTGQKTDFGSGKWNFTPIEEASGYDEGVFDFTSSSFLL
jgi:hypothetical protein